MFKESSNLILSDEERTKLKSEFDQLETIDQKYEFWKTRFDFDYSEHFRLEQLSIIDFKIIPKDANETELLNKRFFENYFHFYGNTGDNRLVQMKAEFTESINNSMNKEMNVEYELKKIDDYIFSSKHHQPKKSLFGAKYTQSKSEWFFLGYEQYLLNKKEFDWTEKLYHPKSINEIFSGIEWAKYREFVKAYLSPKKKRDDIKLNGEQKFLILNYLGLGNEIELNTKRSRLFEFFIDELSYNSIRPMFSDIKLYETEDNLNTIIDLFKLLKLDSQARDIEEKLPKKNKARQRN